MDKKSFIALASAWKMFQMTNPLANFVAALQPKKITVLILSKGCNLLLEKVPEQSVDPQVNSVPRAHFYKTFTGVTYKFLQ
jgi:hypothetical protein